MVFHIILGSQSFSFSVVSGEKPAFEKAPFFLLIILKKAPIKTFVKCCKNKIC